MLLHVYDNDLPELLTALAATPPMQRLRAVGMNCGCEYTAFPRFARGRSYSRWVHSLGVGSIVWRFTHDPAQAAAGLLHDVATPTFAHVIDFLRGDYLTQEATEEGTRERIAASPELQSILRAHGLTTDDVADYHRYPIADNDSPRLSADRLEYTLGNAWRYGFLTEDGIEALYADLTVSKNEDGADELCFRTRKQAVRFAETALACARVYVSDEDRCAMQTLCELLRDAIEAGILSPADLDGTEPPLIETIAVSPLSERWSAFCAMAHTARAPASSAPPDGRPWRIIPAKKRRIDPLVAGMGRVSSLDAAFAASLAAFLNEPQTEWVLGW